MRALRIISRNIRDSFKGVFRNFSLSIASISCIAITLIVVSISIILSDNVNNFTTLVEEDVTIVTFLSNDISSERVSEINAEINKLDNIANVSYESKMEIADEMKSSSDVFKNLMEDWTEDENPLQSTYLVKVKDIEKIGETANQIKNIEGVSVVKYGEGMVEQLVTVFDMVRKISIVIVAALVVVTAFLITNTIKITIFSRKREIEIMRLVGASNLNIKIPFIFEGLLLGMLGSIVPICLTIYGYIALYNHFNGQLFSPFIQLMKPQPFVYFVSLILLAIGVVVGMFGSLNAVRKHLKV
ncbi:MAG: permease-like cell division protein FtsX [Tenericutes bacterium]|nr:permease-like cell division protein FtsX [Mycoplasmatota bacterium]